MLNLKYNTSQNVLKISGMLFDCSFVIMQPTLISFKLSNCVTKATCVKLAQISLHVFYFISNQVAKGLTLKIA